MINWDIIRDQLDNPILVKHVRSRLRRQPVAVGVVVVVALSLCISWAGYQLDWFLNGRAFEWLVVLQGIILVAIGASQVGSAVAGARKSGILDFHRVSPLTPAQLTLGFFFGAPIREYLLFAATLPFCALFMAFGVPSFHVFVELMILVIAIAWLFHGFALLNALITQGQASTRGTVGVVIFLLLFAFSMTRGGRMIPTVALFDGDARLEMFGYPLPWLAVVLAFIIVPLFFTYLAARRKMASERIHPLSKPQAIAALVSVGFLSLGATWQQEDPEPLRIGTLYVLAVTAMVVTVMVTPTEAEYVQGLWRAHKLGRPGLLWWDDLALNRTFLAIAAGIVLATTSIAWSAGQPSEIEIRYAETTQRAYPLACAAGVLVVVYFGLARQYFLLRSGQRGKTYFGLFLFLTWILPLVIGSILAFSTNQVHGGIASQMLFCLSPIPGLGMVAASHRWHAPDTAIEAMLITPALLFVFVFNMLLVNARRRVFKAFRDSASSTEAQTVDLLATDVMAVQTVPIPLTLKPETSP